MIRCGRHTWRLGRDASGNAAARIGARMRLAREDGKPSTNVGVSLGYPS